MVKNKLGNEISFDVQNQAMSVPFLQIDVRKNCRDKRNRRNTIKTCREPKDNNYKNILPPLVLLSKEKQNELIKKLYKNSI